MAKQSASIVPPASVGDETVTALILAGGRGARMGGQDKGLLRLAGRPLVAHVLTALRPQVATVWINANRNLDAYAAFGLPVLTDAADDFPGPLAGIHAGLSRLTSGWLLCVPCDAVRLPPDLVARLCRGASDAGATAAYAVTGDTPHYPLCLLHHRLADAVATQLAGPSRSVRGLLSAVAAVPIALPVTATPVLNLNTPAALADCERRWGG
mgnify:CR=1 FL=1